MRGPAERYKTPYVSTRRHGVISQKTAVFMFKSKINFGLIEETFLEKVILNDLRIFRNCFSDLTSYGSHFGMNARINSDMNVQIHIGKNAPL